MASSLHDFLASILPSDVKVAGVPIDSAHEDMFAVERLVISRAVDKRRREFSAGRAYARLALAAWGCPPQPIPVSANRVPLWPKGYVGSISHSNDLCAAVVAKTEVYAALGLDIESAAPLPVDLQDMICRREEQFCRSIPGCDLAKLLFVAKEAVFKAYYPLTGIFLDFHDVVIEVDSANTSFEATLIDHEKRHVSANRPLVGRFGALDAHIVAVVTIARAAMDDNAGKHSDDAV